jgi:hypothetical protein
VRSFSTNAIGAETDFGSKSLRDFRYKKPGFVAPAFTFLDFVHKNHIVWRFRILIIAEALYIQRYHFGA